MHCGGSSCDPSIQKLVYWNSDSVPKIEIWVMFIGFYRMSENIVYPSSVPSCPFLGMSSSKLPVPYLILEVDVVLCALWRFVLKSKFSNTSLQGFRISHEVRGLVDVYRSLSDE